MFAFGDLVSQRENALAKVEAFPTFSSKMNDEIETAMIMLLISEAIVLKAHTALPLA